MIGKRQVEELIDDFILDTQSAKEAIEGLADIIRKCTEAREAFLEDVEKEKKRSPED